MYYLVELQDIVRVPPNRFNDDLKSVVLDICRETYEETIDPELGMILAITSVNEISQGRLVHGDGATYHQIRLSVIAYKPVTKEIVEGEVSEVTDFGAFVRIGSIEALCHISQIADDFFSLSKTSLVGRESGNVVRVGDRLRARIITISMDRSNIRTAITMRQPGLGIDRWIEAWKHPKEEEKEPKKEPKKRVKKKPAK
ncbi:MAG: DNA-directed RNA polymerase [Candidatus Heimdallarchaeota archaeon]